MRRLRFFRLLLPGALLLFLVLFVVELKPRNVVQIQPAPEEAAGQRVEDLNMRELVGTRQTLALDAGLVQQLEDGRMHLEDIHSFEIQREDQQPLIVSSEMGDVTGEPGSRVMWFRRGVVIRDTEDDLMIRIPELQVDEAAGEARSTADVFLQGGEVEGEAGRLIYGLQGQPTQLFDLRMKNADGGTLSARRALLHDGLNDVELIDDVRMHRGVERLLAARCRMRRTEDEQPEDAEASGDVEGTVLFSSPEPVDFASDNVDVDWDESGEVRELLLAGEARVVHAPQRLAADTIRARRFDVGERAEWRVHADGSVEAEGRLDDEPGLVRAQTLLARFDAEFELVSAEAIGGMSFVGPATRAEADRAVFSAGTGKVRLFGAAGRRARLSRENTRIAAERIETDQRGDELHADRRVEATMLARKGEGDSEGAGPFLAGEAVHFVARKLDGSDGGARLVFEGDVRGWQGDRNLSADRMLIEQGIGRLLATGNVNTRLPREEGTSTLSEADYVQISAEELEYAEANALAEYRGGVRVRLADGWMEADRMELILTTAGREIQEMRAFGNVRLEHREPVEDGAPQLVNGEADRLVYTPADETVMFYGDDAPAAVRRVGPSRDSTTGRVLRYRMDTGELEVDSGEGGPARIRTTGTAPDPPI